jgi:hypothetical protein
MYDAFFPQGYGLYKNPRIINADACLGGISTSNFYKYYAFSPCLINPAAFDPTALKLSSSIGLCANNAVCNTDLTKYLK